MSEAETAPPARRGLGAFAPLIVLALIVAAAAVVLFQGGTRRDLAATGLIGKPIPAYNLPSLNGDGVVTPAAFAGKPHLVNAFASWCGPCKIEHPMLTQLAASGVPVLGVVYRDKPEAAAKFLEQLGNPYTAVGLDPQGQYAIEIGIMGVPETYIVDGQGRIRHIVRGPLTPEIIETRVMPLLNAAAEGR